jgi:hypothetical protein
MAFQKESGRLFRRGTCLLWLVPEEQRGERKILLIAKPRQRSVRLVVGRQPTPSSQKPQALVVVVAAQAKAARHLQAQEGSTEEDCASQERQERDDEEKE